MYNIYIICSDNSHHSDSTVVKTLGSIIYITRLSTSETKHNVLDVNLRCKPNGTLLRYYKISFHFF